MVTIITNVPIDSVINYRDIVIEDYQVRFFMAYNLSANRWMLNIDNQTLNRQAYSITMNQGTDMLNAHGYLDLQALVLLNVTSITGLEADAVNLGSDLLLVYMDMDTYHSTILDDAIGGRTVYRVGQ